MLDIGLRGMIGKGPRNAQVIEAIKKHKAVYFAAIGGAGAKISESIKKADVVAYPELGPEAIYRLEVEDFPCIVAIDTEGNDLYKIGVAQYKLAAAQKALQLLLDFNRTYTLRYLLFLLRGNSPCFQVWRHLSLLEILDCQFVKHIVDELMQKSH